MTRVVASAAIAICAVLSGAAPASASTAWRVQRVPQPPGSIALLQGVSCPAKGNCTAVGLPQERYRVHAGRALERDQVDVLIGIGPTAAYRAACWRPIPVRSGGMCWDREASRRPGFGGAAALIFCQTRRSTATTLPANFALPPGIGV